MLFPAIILIAGLLILVKSSTLSIKYSVKLSKLLGISRLAVGFLIISLITTLPEMSIAILSGLEGNGLLSVGNLFGSNIVNICLIFGLVAILANVTIRRDDYREIIRIISITSTVAVVLLLLGKLNFIFGLFCITTFLLFFYNVYKNEYALKTKKLAYKGLKTVELVKTFVYTIISVLFVVISAKLVTDSAIQIADVFGVTQSFIGATIVAIGTSLPELSIALTSIKRKVVSLAVGDLIGSLVTNLTLIIGITSLFGTVIIGDITRFLAIFFLFVNMAFLFLISAMKCTRTQGMILVSIYVAFLIALVNYQIFFI